MKLEGMREAANGMKALRGKMDDVAAKALNRTAQGVSTEAGRAVRQHYNVKPKEIKNAVRINLTNASSLEAEVVYRGPNLPVLRFGALPKMPKPGKRSGQVKVAVKIGGKKAIKPAFPAKMSSGHIGIFKRSYPTGRFGNARRRMEDGKQVWGPELPIEEVFGPAVPVMMGETQVVDKVQQEAKRRMDQRLDHEIGRILR